MKNSHRMGGKMDPKWLGPYTVVEKLSKGRYCLKSAADKHLKKLYSSNVLKEYYEPGKCLPLEEGSAVKVLESMRVDKMPQKVWKSPA
jgi:hypothetical protein